MEYTAKKGRDASHEFFTTKERFERIANAIRENGGRDLVPEIEAIVFELFTLVPDLDSVPQKARARVLLWSNV